MAYNFIKTGAFAGKTVNLGGYQFVEGIYTLSANAEGVLPSEKDAQALHKYLGGAYQAYLEGSQELEAAMSGEPVTSAKVEVQADPGRARDTAARNALSQLDPENDEHWTGQGLPSVEAVRAIAADDSISRADIQGVAPKLNREEARKIAADNADPLKD